MTENNIIILDIIVLDSEEKVMNLKKDDLVKLPDNNIIFIVKEIDIFPNSIFLTDIKRNNVDEYNSNPYLYKNYSDYIVHLRNKTSAVMSRKELWKIIIEKTYTIY
jgi:hypothetical protein